MERMTDNIEAEEALKDATRVRNLLARTPDEALDHTLHSVIPESILRLDQVCTTLYTTGGDALQKRKLQQVQGHAIGALAHALQRLRNASTLKACWVCDLCQALPLLQSATSRTLAIALLEVGVPRAFPVAPCLPGLFQCLNDRHGAAVLLADGAVTESAEKQLDACSWLVLDALALQMDMPLYQDWERETYTGVDSPPWHRDRAASLPGALDALAGDGVMDLLLDVVLFWPISRHRTEQMDNTTGLSMAGLARINHRCKEGTVWNEIYLRHLKYVCMKYILTESQGRDDSLSRSGGDRLLLLAVLAAVTNSTHGRLAYAFVSDKVGPHPFDQARVPSSASISWGLASSLLIMVLGDENAASILQKYKHVQSCWEEILGTRPIGMRYRRAPLPVEVADQVVHFLQYNISVQRAMEALEENGSTAPLVWLFVDLAVKTQDPRRPGLFWGIDLIAFFFQSLSTTHCGSKTRQVLYSKCIQAAVAALETVPPSNDDAWIEDPVDREREPLPLGVPEEYSNREDINGLLHKHRMLQRKRTLQSYQSMEARKVAYRIISDCFRIAGILEKDMFAVPIILFQCIASEDSCLLPLVAQSLFCILDVFNEELPSETIAKDCLHSFVAPLLPSLVCATTSNSSDAREVARAWSQDLIESYDSEVAGLMLDFLGSETGSNHTVSTPNLREPHLYASTKSTEYVHFFDLRRSDSQNEMLRLIMGRVKTLSELISTSPSAALALLVKFDFSLEAAKQSFLEDYESAIRESGIALRMGATRNVTNSGDTCLICYNHLGPEDSFALPCGHQFCKPCLRIYLSTQVDQSGKQRLRIACPEHKCNEVISLLEVELIDPTLGKQFCAELISAFVDCDPDYAECPRAGCRVILRRQSPQNPSSVCCDSCSQTFCFDCGALPHIPAACEEITRWNRLFGSSAFWIKKHAKPCPSCAAPIEKSGGCNHIRCQVCQADFCWICSRFLRSHREAHVCNRYDAATEDTERSIFFTDRYQAHEDAEAVAKERASFVQKHRDEIVTGLWYASESERDAYIATFDRLVRARSFLKHSYVTAWSQKTSSSSDFENQQALLEVATGKLSQLTMSRLDETYSEKGNAGIRSLFRSVTFYTKVVHTCMKRLLQLKNETNAVNHHDLSISIPRT
jgi:ariadne-1